MKETIKSAVIGLLALAGLILYLSTRPKPPRQWTDTEAGEILFPGFTDASLMRRVTIARIGGDGQLERLELRSQGQEWKIATRSMAPAENSERIASIASPLVGLTALSVVPRGETNDRLLRECHLIDPTKALGEEIADSGIFLEILGEDDALLAKMIIGSQPAESSAVRDLRYVLPDGSDRVMTVDFSAETAESAGQHKSEPYADRLSADPLDWMNRSLLRLSRWKIAELSLFDYRWEEEKLRPVDFLRAEQDPERSLDLVWQVKQHLRFEDGQPKEEELPEEGSDEAKQLGKTFNRWADLLGKLSFIDLRRKADPLPEMFRRHAPIQEIAASADELALLGFHIADHDPRAPESIDPFLCGGAGEIELTMTDGTCFRLIIGAERGDGSRWSIVTCRFDPSFFPEVPEADSAARSQREMDIAQGEKSAGEASRRLDDWFFLIPQEMTVGGGGL